LLAFYASTPAYLPVLEVEGWEQVQPELNMLSKSGRWEEMPNMIDDTMLETLAAIGTPKQVAADVLERFGDEVDRVAFYPPQALSHETLAELVDELGRIRTGGAS
jgi:alkanesulfonate monooxygenase SsuD/methylene tetrahydromethanopterin reductase-like flavin-dependent oxidoreductase (luciferase family)